MYRHVSNILSVPLNGHGEVLYSIHTWSCFGQYDRQGRGQGHMYWHEWGKVAKYKHRGYLEIEYSCIEFSLWCQQRSYSCSALLVACSSVYSCHSVSMLVGFCMLYLCSFELVTSHTHMHTHTRSHTHTRTNSFVCRHFVRRKSGRKDH